VEERWGGYIGGMKEEADVMLQMMADGDEQDV
jgi:hypothetical protein